jgi:hypothetical protein
MAALIGAVALLTIASSQPVEPEFRVEVEEVIEDEPEEVAVVVEPYGVWDRLAACESTGRWFVSTGNGYFGGLQMDMTFWRRYGGMAYAARPNLASREIQIQVARRGQAVQGWGAWPACSRRLGLR